MSSENNMTKNILSNIGNMVAKPFVERKQKIGTFLAKQRFEYFDNLNFNLRLGYISFLGGMAGALLLQTWMYENDLLIYNQLCSSQGIKHEQFEELNQKSLIKRVGKKLDTNNDGFLSPKEIIRDNFQSYEKALEGYSTEQLKDILGKYKNDSKN
jgi:hypothetical protein